MAKQKMKTKRAAKKRYQLTGKGRVKVGRKGMRHCLSHRGRKNKRHLRGTMLLEGADEANAKRLIPYS